RQAGLDVDTVCLAGAHDLASDDDSGVVTEVVTGVYALMDHNYGSLHPGLKHAAKLLTTVITHPELDLAWLDTGQKAASADTGLPAIDGIPGATLTRMSAEHGGVALEGDAQSEFEIGDKVWLIPADIANCANLYDYIYAAQDGKLVATWEVAARGRYR
ncbi:MAG: DSD1 family PLP-dependent enzyme, partial [SAR202 cluster bacterium]|nr:DSD1 family PLP-dependent enzyme [SAR202 cluster bacterium]